MSVTKDMTWKIEYTRLDPEHLIVEESLFSLGNGYLGVRGNFEELKESKERPTIRGTYINGFYDDVPITYDEKAFGFPETKQKMVNLPDAQTIRIQCGDEWFDLFEGTILNYRRTLDMRKGYTERVVHLLTPKGKELTVTFRRLVSFQYQELFAQEVLISSQNYRGPIRFQLILDGDVENYVAKDDPRLASGNAKNLAITDYREMDDGVLLKASTLRSFLDVYCYMRVNVNVPYQEEIQWIQDGRFEWTIDCELWDEPIVLYKQNLYVDSIRHQDPLNRLQNCLDGLADLTFSDLIQLQRESLDRFYQAADITIDGDEKLQEGIRFNLYHLFQSVGRDQFSNIAAKGLSGEGYEGHYFWDTEIYIIPVFINTLPELAKNLLRYRYQILDGARQHARIMGHKKGALYPWRTIKGSECSSYFPAGSAQYHINADIGYSFIQYYLVTNDRDFLFQYGAEVLFETARLFIDVGHYHDGKFHIYNVTGPDEYTAIVNDNFYTNAMVQYHLRWAVKVYDMMKREDPDALELLVSKIGLQESEIEAFEQASTNMTLLIDETRNIHQQDDHFLSKPIWHFEGTPSENYPLLLHYHPLTIYRHQVCKQADVILAHFLLDDFSEELMRNSYYYYEAITTHDSSLSSCIYSIMAARIGEVEKAYQYFIETARTDLDNTHKNTKDGLHMANMGGTYLGLVYGFAGLRIKENGLVLRPKLPQAINHIAFSLQYQGRQLRVNFTHSCLVLELRDGEPLTIQIDGELYTVTPEKAIRLNWSGEKWV